MLIIKKFIYKLYVLIIKVKKKNYSFSVGCADFYRLTYLF